MEKFTQPEQTESADEMTFEHFSDDQLLAENQRLHNLVQLHNQSANPAEAQGFQDQLEMVRTELDRRDISY
jgi:hypothetical protein